MVDDHSIVRFGLVKILNEEPDIEVIAEAGGYDDLFAYLRASRMRDNQPDIILLDLSTSGKNGLEVLGELKEFYPNVRVLMLSTSYEDLYGVRAIKAGAAGYITRESATEELVTAIREIYTKRKYISPVLAKKLIDSLDKQGNKPEHERLSNRELQVLSMIASGKKMKEIAEILSLSPATVATYRARIMEKMHLRSNVELANYAVRHNLVN